jgi:Icc protein
MLIAQLTDIHIGFDTAAPVEANLVRLEQTLVHLAALPNRPDALLLTGDLTEAGTPESYATLVTALAETDIPVWPIPGNHDVREAMLAAFPQIAAPDGFIHYAVEGTDFRIVMIDTLEPGRHGGGFCEARAEWLSETLAARPDTPTLIAMHHPPFAAGIAWMDTDPTEPWVARFRRSVAGHPQVSAITAGHVHRANVARWADNICMICPSTSPAVALDLSPISAERPDDRALIANELPGYMLHHWDGSALVSHVMTARAAPALATYAPALQPMIAGMLAERPSR